MDATFDHLCLEILHAGNHEQFRHLLAKAADHLGFERHCGMIAVDISAQRTTFTTVGDNTPTAYLPKALDRDSGRQDPVMQYLRYQHRPLSWDIDFYLQAGKVHKWEEQAPFGYASGVSAVLHMPHGRHFTLGFCTSLRKLQSCSSLSELKAKTYLLCSHAHEASARLFLSAWTDDIPQLTERELSCLQWTLAGKTTWELGQITHMSERTAAALLRSAATKLDCVNKHQAALRAYQLGLLRL